VRDLHPLENPDISFDEIDKLYQTMPERVFRQEILAEFMESGGGVFRRVLQAATATPQDKALFQHDYVFGVDWGRSKDFTVITVLDTTLNEVVAIDRFTQIDYDIQVNRLKAMASRFQPVQIIAESNSMGGPLVEQLQLDGLPVKGFMTTSASKEEAIRALEGAFERQEIHIIDDPVLIGELQAYEQEQLPAGKFRFSAPAGLHDDCVISLAIAWHSIAGGWFMWADDDEDYE
jgi:phage FluMu gp28-like protein